MSAFSFTAPFMSEEQEKEEWDAMDEKEREALRRDLYGDERGGNENNNNNNLPSIDQAMLPGKIEQVEDALHNRLPESETRAYREALRVAPHVVTAETDMGAFLWVEKGDAVQAAQRIAKFWQVRTEVFGPELAYRPMTLLDGGAVANDVWLMDLGLAYLLPDDKHGRAVMFIDRTRYTAQVGPLQSFLRLLYYMFFSMTTRGNKRRNEFVLIPNVKVCKIAIQPLLRQHRRQIHPLLVRARHFISYT